MPFDRPYPGSNIGSGEIVAVGDLTGTVTSSDLDLSGINWLTLTIAVTRPAAGVSAVQMFQDVVEGGNPFVLQDKEETAPPVKTLADEEESKAIPGAGTTRWSTRLNVASLANMRFRFTGTAAAAGDVISVSASGAG